MHKLVVLIENTNFVSIDLAADDQQVFNNFTQQDTYNTKQLCTSRDVEKPKYFTD